MAYCEDSATLYIAFRGSVDLDDWLVNLDTEMVKLNDHLYEAPEEFGPDDFDPEVQCHQGFTKRAKKWMDVLVPKMDMYPSKIICTTGHSLGAATSAMVHILLNANFNQIDFPDMTLVFYNVTFALPLFGNLALKNHMQESNSENIKIYNSENMKNMFHFVNYDDIVPAVGFIPHVFNNLSYFKQFCASSTKFLSKLLMSFEIMVPESGEQKNEFDEIVKRLAKQIAERKGTYNPLFEKIRPETYMPIGTYIFMKDSELYEFPFSQGSDHQWVGQLISESLKILRSAVPDVLKNHAVDTYGSQMTRCLTNGVHENFMFWKMESD